MNYKLLTYGVVGVAFVVMGICTTIIYQMGSADKTNVVFLDVGQGDAALISYGTDQILIDGGPNGTVLLEELNRYMPFWDRTIEIVVATHPDADHIDGLINVFEHYRVQQFWHTSTYKDSATLHKLITVSEAEEGLESIAAVYGSRVHIGNSSLRVIYPYMQDESGDDGVNDEGIIMVFDIGDERFYFGGDASSTIEDELMLDEKITVLKASHHGSHLSTSTYFLNKTRPRDVIISSGIGNRYGHPHDDTLTRTFRSGAQVLRTDQLGSIMYSCDQNACTR